MKNYLFIIYYITTNGNKTSALNKQLSGTRQDLEKALAEIKKDAAVKNLGSKGDLLSSETGEVLGMFKIPGWHGNTPIVFFDFYEEDK